MVELPGFCYHDHTYSCRSTIGACRCPEFKRWSVKLINVHFDSIKIWCLYAMVFSFLQESHQPDCCAITYKKNNNVMWSNSFKNHQQIWLLKWELKIKGNLVVAIIDVCCNVKGIKKLLTPHLTLKASLPVYSLI